MAIDPKRDETVVYRDDDAEIPGLVVAARTESDRRTKVAWSVPATVPTWELTDNLRVVGGVPE